MQTEEVDAVAELSSKSAALAQSTATAHKQGKVFL